MIITTRFNDMSVTDVTEKWRVKVKFNDFVVTDVTENWHVKVLMLKGEKGDTGDAGDYSALRNKPQINGVTLVGNKTASDLNLATEADLEDVQSDIADLQTAVGNNTSDITDLQTDVGNNTGDISDLQTAVGNNTSDISDLQTAVSTKADASDLEDLEAEVALKADASDLDLYVPKSGGTMTGALVANGKHNMFAYMPYSFTTNGGSDTTGYARIATIEITNSWATAPIEFKVLRRNSRTPITLTVLFSGGSGTDPNITSFYYEGDTYYSINAFLTKTSAGVWDVYLNKTEAADSLTVYTYVPNFMQVRCRVTYSNSLLTSVPSGAVMATLTPPPAIGVGNPQMVRFNVANGTPKTITASSECALLISSTGWATNIRSGLWFIAGYSDSSRADITTIKSASAISITGTSGLAWTITNTQSGTTADITVLVLWGAVPTVS